MRQVSDKLLTQEGWQRFHEELIALQKRRDAKLKDYVNTRAANSDESYADPLQNEIAIINRRIAQLQAILDHAVPVSNDNRQNGKIGIGSHVDVLWENGGEESYIVVGSAEADPDAGRISYESPVGKALMGRHTDDKVDVMTPAGLQRLRVMATK